MTLIDRPRMQVLIGGRDLTDRCDSLVFSAVDNGGFEICTLGLPSADRPTKGSPVTIRQGLEVAWAGRVTEIADHSQHERATKTTGCEGYRALLKDNPMQMVYVDRELAQWKPPGAARQIELLTGNTVQGTFQVGRDLTGENLALVVRLPGAYNGAPDVDCWYDAGPGNVIASVYVSQSESAMPASWSMAVYSVINDAAGFTQIVRWTTTPNAGYQAFPTPRRFAMLVAEAPNTNNTGNLPYLAQWINAAVYGNHGLTRRGPDPGGFYPSDIVRHALSQAKGVQPGVIIDSTSYIAPHVVYRTPTEQDVLIDDMAKLMGWAWGVWEPPTILSEQPRLDFRPPPTDATAIVSKAECDELDITSRLGDLYDTCVVTYTDAAGSLGEVTVLVANPQLAEAGIVGRTLQLPGGLSSEAGARSLGTFALLLSQVSARAAGQATLPVSVKLPGGGSKPSALLRPGIDRLRITDLLAGGPLLAQGTGRQDVFRIGRTETTVSKDGVPSTRVELDNGTNLMETLQARLALQAGVVGSGAG